MAADCSQNDVECSATGQSGSISGTNPSTTSTNNQLAVFSYDAAGRETSDGVGDTYTYDAEGRILSANGNAYVYDGAGNRVKKTVSGTVTLYWPGLGGQIIDESNSTASTMAKQVYFGGTLVWRESAATGVGIFLFQDHLGSTRLTADASGNVKDNISYYPFGKNISYTTTTTDNHYGFTGYEDDGDSEYAVNRNLNTVNWGRFNRPDPYGGSYDFTNPQSLNRYAYVQNSPLQYVDPTGTIRTSTCVETDRNCSSSSGGGTIYVPGTEGYGFGSNWNQFSLLDATFGVGHYEPTYAYDPNTGAWRPDDGRIWVPGIGSQTAFDLSSWRRIEHPVRPQGRQRQVTIPPQTPRSRLLRIVSTRQKPPLHLMLLRR